jgi:hypothetical protein
MIVAKDLITRKELKRRFNFTEGFGKDYMEAVYRELDKFKNKGSWTIDTSHDGEVILPKMIKERRGLIHHDFIYHEEIITPYHTPLSEPRINIPFRVVIFFPDALYKPMKDDLRQFFHELEMDRNNREFDIYALRGYPFKAELFLEGGQERSIYTLDTKEK